MAPTRSQLHMLERKSDTTSCKQSTATDEPVVPGQHYDDLLHDSRSSPLGQQKGLFADICL